MAVKPISPVKPKTARKPKTASIINNKISSEQSDFSHLAEDIISNINVGIYIVQNGKFVYLSPLFQKLSGYSYADLAGTNPLDYLHPDDREDVRIKAIQLLKGNCSNAYEYSFTRKTGEVMWVLEMVTSITYKEERAALVCFMDITERRKMEETMHHPEERYQTILDEMEDGYFENDLAGNLTFVNDAYCRSVGYTREELLGANFRDQVAKEDVESVYDVYHKIYRTGKPERGICYKLICKDGTTVLVELAAFPRQNQNGEIIGFRGVGRDITKRREMEETLRQSEERYRTILDEMDDGYFEVDLAGNFTFVNDADCRLVGYSREELIGTNFRSQMTKEAFDILYNTFRRIYSTGKHERGISYQAIRKDGTTGLAEIAGFPLQNQKGEIVGFRGIARDITERRQMEERIRQSEERYRTILDEMADAYYEVDLAGNFTGTVYPTEGIVQNIKCLFSHLTTEICSDQFFSGISHETAICIIDEGKITSQIYLKIAVVHFIKYRPVSLFGLPESLFHFPALGDIPSNSPETDDLSILILTRESCKLDQDRCPILANKLVANAPFGFTGSINFMINIIDRLYIFFCYLIPEVCTEQFFSCVSHATAIGIINEGQVTGQIILKVAILHFIKYGPVSLLRMMYRFFHFSAFGNIHKTYKSGALSFIGDRCNHFQDPHDHAVLSGETVFISIRTVTLQKLDRFYSYVFPVIGMKIIERICAC